MAISSSSRGLRPGVCTSTTRPSNPYDGMVIYETDTDKVAIYDVNAWVYKTGTTAPALFTVIPASVSVGSGTGSVGASGSVTFSSASSVSLNNCFTTTYDNYRIMLDYIPTQSNGLVSRYRNNGIDESSASYGNAVFFYRSNNTSGGEAANTGLTYSYLINQSANGYTALSIDVINPKKASYSLMHLLGTIGVSSTDVKSFFGIAQLANTNTYDGITFYPLSGTITGTLRVYGYNQ